MLSGGSNRELMQILNNIVAEQKEHEKRLERLETLEFEKAAKSNGCISWLDYVAGIGPSFTLDVPPNPFELGDYGWTHLTIFYYATSQTAGDKTLRMRVNAIAANYGYTYKWARGGAQTIISADFQTSYVISNLRSTWSRTTGWLQIPFFPQPIECECWGDWVAFEGSQEAGSQVERGEFGGRITSGAARVDSLTFFASADNIGFRAFLYGWCPTWDIAAAGPPD